MAVEVATAFPAAGAHYGPGARRLLDRAARERVPLNGAIELTHRCNLACVHCYVNLPAADRAAQRREMSTAEVCRVLDEVSALGALEVTLTGGEPLLRADFPEIFRHGHQLGLLMTVYTNATLITDSILRLFGEHPPVAVDITQYGYTPETYNTVTAAGDQQYARFARGVERLLAAGVNVTLKAVALRANAHEIKDIFDYAERLGREFRIDAIISPRIDGGRGPLAQRLSAAEVVEIETFTQETERELHDYCDVRTGFAPATDALYQCGAGRASWLIDPYGRLQPCTLSRTLGFDVLRDGFAAGWYRAMPTLHAKKRTHDDGCGSCLAHGTCNNCVGMAELEELDPSDGNPYFCGVTDERGQRLFGDAHAVPQGLVRLRRPSERVAAAKP